MVFLTAVCVLMEILQRPSLPTLSFPLLLPLLLLTLLSTHTGLSNY